MTCRASYEIRVFDAAGIIFIESSSITYEPGNVVRIGHKFTSSRAVTVTGYEIEFPDAGVLEHVNQVDNLISGDAFKVFWEGVVGAPRDPVSGIIIDGMAQHIYQQRDGA